MQNPESSVFARFFGSAYAFFAGNATQEVINAAEQEAAQVESRITALTTERDTLSGQITALTTERDSFRSQVEALSGQVGTLTTERDTLAAEATQLRQWQANHAKATGAPLPGADQNQTGQDEILKKYPEGSITRMALEAVIAKKPTQA